MCAVCVYANILFDACGLVSRTRSSLNHIPEDILTDILLRLPSKSLIRFRCVCKSWRDLIGSSGFGRSHLNRNVAKRSNSYLIAYHHSSIDEPGLRQHSLFSNETFEPCFKLKHSLWTKEEFQIYGSSNGLVCISDQELHQNSRICIWNPSIGKSRTLPNIEQRLPYTHLITLSFGFHPELNEYKVVRTVHQIKSPSEVEVYTLSTDSWKRIGVTPAWLNSTRRSFCASAFSNGIVYWLASKGSKDTIVLFDTGSEEFQQVMVPDAISSKSRALCIQPCKKNQLA